MSIPYRVLREQLRRYVLQCATDVARAQAALAEARRQYQHAVDDERDDAMQLAQEFIERRGCRPALVLVNDEQIKDITAPPNIEIEGVHTVAENKFWLEKR